jgi:hypothetical protein
MRKAFVCGLFIDEAKSRQAFDPTLLDKEPNLSFQAILINPAGETPDVSRRRTNCLADSTYEEKLQKTPPIRFQSRRFHSD